MTTADILKIEFESIKADLIKKHDELNQRASGEWAESLESVISESEHITNIKLYGNAYTEQLVNGRKPGKFPPIKAIEKWIYDKGISAVGKDISISSLAFLIARKIANEGTKIYQKGGTDLISSVITPERIQRIINQVSEINLTVIVNGMIEQLKEVA